MKYKVITVLFLLFISARSLSQTVIGKDMIAFTGETITGIKVSNKDLKGKVTLLNFWFPGCKPCITEFEALKNLYEKYKSNNKLQILSFTFGSRSKNMKIIEKYNLPYSIIPVSSGKCNKWSFNSGYPTNIITDSNGKIRHLETGGAISNTEATAHFNDVIIPQIEKLL